LKRLRTLGVRVVAFTLEEHGALVAVSGAECFIPPYHAEAGGSPEASDSYMAALIYSALFASDRHLLPWTVGRMGRRCAIAAGLTSTEPRFGPPTLVNVEHVNSFF
jgi:hypothetical protein